MSECRCKTVQCCPPSDFQHEAQPVRLWYAGDFGTGQAEAAAVGQMATVREGDILVTGGDNNYGTSYPAALAPYQRWVDRRLVLPCPGNHDWDENELGDYLAYFQPVIGNNRYYEARLGPVHLFVLDSGWNSAGDLREPDGNSIGSTQYRWLEAATEVSDAPWKIAVVHTPPYSSGAIHGSTPTWQWPFDQMGINLVLSGHVHNYERLEHLGVTYLVNGCGGQAPYGFGEPIQASVYRHHDEGNPYGLSLLTISGTKLRHEFVRLNLPTRLDVFELIKLR